MIFNLSRKSTTITNSHQLAQYLAGSSVPTAGVEVNAETAIRHGTVFACVRVLAESIGQLPLNLMRKQGRERNKAADHPLYSILRRSPNPLQTAQEWKELVTVHLNLDGNHYSLINRGGSRTGKVLELLPLNPNSVQPKLGADGASVTYEVTFANGKRDTFDAGDVLHIKAMSVGDPLRGVSPIAYARETLGLSIATARHAAQLFANGANPGGVLTSPAELSQEAYDRLKGSWGDRHQGVSNAHRVAILEAGMKWQQVGLSAEDSQMLDSRKLSRTEICGLFRVPPSMIGDLERATYSNTEQQGRSFVDFSLMPWLTRIENRCDMQLLTDKERRDGYFTKHNVNALARGDMTTRSNFYTRQLQNGAMSPNEIRELEDMNPRDGGDTFLTPLNLTQGAGAPNVEGSDKPPA